MKDFKKMLAMIGVIILMIAISLFAEQSDFNQNNEDLVGMAADKTPYDKLIDKGFKLFAKEDYPNAKAIFEEAVKLDSTKPAANFWIGRTILESSSTTQQKQEALQYFQKAYSLESDSAEKQIDLDIITAMLTDPSNKYAAIITQVGEFPEKLVDKKINPKDGLNKGDVVVITDAEKNSVVIIFEDTPENKAKLDKCSTSTCIKLKTPEQLENTAAATEPSVVAPTTPVEPTAAVLESKSKIQNDGSVTFNSKDGKTMFIVPAGQTDIYICNDEKCENPVKCSKCKFEKKDSKQTFFNNGAVIETNLAEDETPEIIREKNEDFCIKDNNIITDKCQYIRQGLTNAVNIATAPFRAEVERIISPYVNALLDEFWIGSNRNFLMAWCGAKYYEKEGSQIQAFAGIADSWKTPVSYGVQDPNDIIYNGLLTGESTIIKLSGTKEEITPEMYRYSGRAQLIGNLQYTVYFFNSCTKENSLFEGGFLKLGQLTAAGSPNYDIQQYNDYFTGAATTFNCRNGPCRFNQLCARTIKTIKNDEQKEEETCVTLMKKKFLTPFKDGKPDESGSIEC